MTNTAPHVMRPMSHETLVSTVLRHVNAWRRARGWSRETVVQAIVEAHESREAPTLTGIRFEPSSTDQFTRMKANADRVFRWLDDQTKDGNLLPANFLPSILAAMPADHRRGCVNDLLRDVSLEASAIIQSDDAEFCPVLLLRACIKEGAEANQALANLCDGADEAELEDALRETMEAIEALQTARSQINMALAKKKAGGGQ